ncbi:cytochrome-c oxidase, cbb3-type subunit III [Novosphingobium sp.]|uniref:cytochrome-c oxidase, cbb3-type subunit III n=1 Tax=Novosphingobium sp. TaxID=1874826 RepID=UPI0022BBF89C|nr:cytochrome-c oxidase, cbb3-type subunit III [Novosphingobium sp.]MCZ8018084.1 cytochrome-c oxidase, cbb3-type subunit III [Novosphingobium sp.]MCZ8034403.1 cytochrome-c oxidase, cbb3-type subunit III [Novosphingobium sp.]MCZ8052371.1 cytochrome-c oxidase, cbb3-type subunit III [Novosphingobium sp.]MCZ8061236.1 cytochrome-c oxidase, cbb3-type subunit III [Novosphingobium sp.]MCZ8232867.1 cytochrome-c oxidase, cbb3-type subunit III [Novosphingobium sp.]
MANKRIDEATGIETVGHSWDGIEELNNPLPRWWLWTLYATIVFSIGYVIVYPAWPMVNRATEGLWGWSSRGQLAGELKAEEARRAATLAALATTPITELPGKPELMRAAIEGGRAAFRVNCVQCHGSGAAGSTGYPNLRDDDWLWGGNLQEIEYTLINGIRHPGNDATHQSLMPSFGKDGILPAADIAAVTDHVLSLSGKGPANARGAELFANNCATCHAPDGKGLRQFGAPNLSDAIWLYGGKREQVEASIYKARAGVMPAWNDKLDPVTIKMLAAYVHSLGGGEDFAPAPVAAAAAAAAAPAAGAGNGQD